MQSNLFCNNCGPAFNQTNNSPINMSKMNSYAVPGAYAGPAVPTGQNFHRSFAGQNYNYPTSNTRNVSAPENLQLNAMQMRAHQMRSVQQMHPQQMHPQQMHPQQMHPQQMNPSTSYNMQSSNVQPSEFTMMHPSPDTMHLYGEYANQNRNFPFQQPNSNSIHLLNKSNKKNPVTAHYQHQQKNNRSAPNIYFNNQISGGGYQANYVDSNNKLLDAKLAHMAGTDRLDKMNSETKKLVEMYRQSTLESSPQNNIYGNYDMVNQYDE
jgi:glutaredoxin